MKQSKHYYTPFITTLFLLLFGHGVWGQVLTFEFSALAGSEITVNSNTNATGIATSVISRGSGLTAPANGGRFNASNWAIGSIANAISGMKYVEFTVSPNSGYQFSVSSIVVQWQRSNTGNTQIALRSSTDNYMTDIETVKNVTDNTSTQTFTWIFSQSNSSTNVTYRLYSYAEAIGGTGGPGDGSGDDIIVNGVVSQIPAPIITWTGATSTAWNTTTNWSPATVPTSTDNVIIPSSGITNFPVVSGLTIDAGKTVTLNANTRLTVNGNIVNNGTLTLESGATLVQGTGNTASGTGVYNVQQALTGGGGSTPNSRFWYMGSPLSGASSTAFDAAGDNKLWTYAEATQSYSEITANGVAMSPIQGHVARLGASSTINFTGGALNSGDYTNNSLTNTGTGSTRGYTLISNPYPSFLDWDLIAAGATGIATSLWYRTNDGSGMVYDTYNATGGVSTLNSGVSTNPRYIPPMQAFWVYNPTDGTTGSLTISNNMRSHQTNGGLKDATDFPAFVRLNLENDGAIDQTVLYFDNNAAAGYDNFDSDKMLVPNTAQVYTFVGNKKLAINGMKSVKANKQVPLTVEFPTAKAYSFNATEVAMFDGIVLLEDRLKKVFQDLTMNPVYDFVADAGTTSDRFVVHFQPNGGVAGIESADDNGIAIVSNATGLVTITLSEELPAMGTIQIIDINGKVIATQAINEQTTTMNINAATGVYHVLVDSSAKVARKKIVITK
jgi:hypothetical protein